LLPIFEPDVSAQIDQGAEESKTGSGAQALKTAPLGYLEFLAETRFFDGGVGGQDASHGISALAASGCVAVAESLANTVIL
jgi:hypothetical protein